MAKEKTDNKKLILWALVALVIGVVIGLLLTGLTTTGNAASALSAKAVVDDNPPVEEGSLILRNLTVSNILANTIFDSEINVNSYLKANSGFYANEALIGNNGLETTYLRTNNISKIEQDTGSIVVENKMVFYDGLEVFNSPLMAGRYNQSTAFTVYADEDPTGVGTSTIAVKAPITFEQNAQYINLSAGEDTNYSGTAYACLTADGTLYRSQTACN